jgi:glycosyltransferase involved in cell wall biosynthesis
MRLSIIVPVYNSEEYLRQCIDSILNQKFEDYELLLINDGSTDDSGNICNEYTERDKRVKVYNQENSGVSAARNIGLEHSTGEWITFVDSDDYLRTNYFFDIENNKDADWILLNIEREMNSQPEVFLDFDNCYFEMNTFTERYSLYPDFPSPWGRFFKSEIIKTNNIRFNQGLKFGEDAVFNISYLQYCRIVYTSNSSSYVYRDTESGLSKLGFDLKNDIILYKEIKAGLEKFDNKKMYNRSIVMPLTRILKAIYFDKYNLKISRVRLLKELIGQNYDVIYQIYANHKIKPFVFSAYFFGSYRLLDYTLSRLKKL